MRTLVLSVKKSNFAFLRLRRQHLGNSITYDFGIWIMGAGA
jgi:hypothetical protein